MKFPGSDRALLAAYAASDAASAAPSQAFGQTGFDFAYRCANRKKCGRVKKQVETLGKMGSVVYRCSWCGTVWPTIETLTLAGQFQSGRGGSPPARLTLAGDLCIIIRDLDETKDLEPGEAWIYSNWLLAGCLSREAVAAQCSEARFMGREWSHSDVRNAIRRSRSWLNKQLKRRGLLAVAEGLKIVSNA